MGGGGGGGDGGGDVGGEVAFVVRAGRTVDDVDGEEAAGNGDDGGVAEETRKAVYVQRRGGDDHLEVVAAGEDALEDAEKEVDVEGTFVRLVDDDDIPGAQKGVGTGLGEQHAVRHERNLRIAGDLAGEAVPVADESADFALQLVGDARRHRDGGEAAGLGAGDARMGVPVGEQMLQGHLGKLGRLAGTRVAADDEDGVGAQGGEDVVVVRGDGEFGRVGEVHPLRGRGFPGNGDL